MNCNTCKSDKSVEFIKPCCFFTKIQLNVVKCSECGLIYLNPRPDKKLGLEYFEKAYANAKGFENISYYRDYNSIIKRNKLRLDSINQLSIPNRKILDFGAGQGHFVKIANDNGWNAQGIEVSIAGRQSAKLNLDLTLIGSVDELKLNEFGIITLWDVIEHLEDPKQTLAELSKYLHPNGFLVIETSNIDSFDFLVHKKNWSYWHVDHLFYYSKSSINHLLDLLDFKEVVDIKINRQTKKTKSEFLQKFKTLLNPKTLYLSIKLRFFSYIYKNNKNMDINSLMTVVYQKNTK
jgi:2-polyprenyl-3-methyl-5-hydroxy-6-metoxy-1,4-benzoquinol methylase